MDDWKDQLKDLYKSYSTTQKNTKGTPHKFDSHTNFRGKFGVNDTGIPLTPKAAKKKMNNRAGYRYPQHLQNINERRRTEAMARHGITDINDPFNKNKKERSAQPAERRNYSEHWVPRISEPPRKPRANIYYDNWTSAPEPEQVTYIWDEPRKKKEPEYKASGKFPKPDEAIASYKKK
jgi:hypothetical protein